MKITDIVIDAEATIGTNPLLVDVKPCYVYIDGKKSDKIEGYRYTVALPQHQFEKIGVKVLGECLIQKPESGYVPVKFENISFRIYWKNGTYDVSAIADYVQEIET